MVPEMNDPAEVRAMLGQPDGPTRRAPLPGGGSEVWLATGAQLLCVVCGNRGFTRREVLMNTSGMTFLDLDWANKAGEGAVCRSCGYVHTFLDVAVEWR